jgi:PAS domain S-box-containing protein
VAHRALPRNQLGASSPSVPRGVCRGTLLANSVKLGRFLVTTTGKPDTLATMAAAVAIALVYFLAARIGLSLLAQPSDVAVFWPASGVATGILVAAGRRAGVALATGVLVGTIAANLVSDMTLLTSLLIGFCNTNEALLVAWLLERWFGPAFTFGDVRRVVGFFAAAGLASATFALGGAAVMAELTATPFWEVWRLWFLSHAVGIVVVAPFLIELAQLRRERPNRAKLTEGVGVLALIVLASIYAVALPTGSWLSFDTDAVVFPLLLWLTARKLRTYAVAGAFVLSMVVIGATTYGIGHFGDVSVSIFARVHGAQVVGAMVTAFTLILTTLFAERERAELTLAERNAQFNLARYAARVSTYAYDKTSKTMQLSEASAAIFGLPQNTTEMTAEEWRSRVHPDDLQRLDAERHSAFDERRTELVSEFRIVRPDGEFRWIEARALITYDAAGHACRMLGVYIDITERRQAEDHKSLLIAELDHRVKNILACVAVIAQHTRDATKSMDDFLKLLNGRLHSLANTHALLSRNRWHGVSIAELVRGELAPWMQDGNTLIDGPDIVLTAEATQPVSMVLHELATNATKYGAFSNGHGRISVRWQRHSHSDARSKLVLEWQEAGGPSVCADSAHGYGTSVIHNLIPYELGGSVDYELAREGVRCRLEIPAKWLQRSRSV